MDNQNTNEVPSAGTVQETIQPEPVLTNTPVEEVPLVNETPVQEKTSPVQTPAPSLMRETVDANGNVIAPGTNSGPDMADKTINAVEGFMDTEDHKGEFNSEEVKKYKTKAILSYIPIVALYFVITKKYKESKYLQFHVNQGIVVTIITATVSIISTILGIIFATETMLKNSVPGWVSFLSYLLYCICFLAMVYGIVNTYNDSSKEIPILGGIKLLK